MLLQITQVGLPFEHSKEKQTLALRLINFHGMSIEVVGGFQVVYCESVYSSDKQ